MSQPVQRRAPVGVSKRSEANENTSTRQPTFVKDAIAVPVARSTKVTATGATMISRKRPLGEKTNSSATDKENGSGPKSVIKQEPTEQTIPGTGQVLLKGSRGFVQRRRLQDAGINNLERTVLHHQEPNVKLEPTDDKAPHAKPVRAKTGAPVKLEPDNVQVVGRKSTSKRTEGVDLMTMDELKAMARMAEDEVEEKRTKHDTLEEDEQWDDLDKEDEGDPLMVAEYVVEIFENMRRQEKETMPAPDYMDTQRELAWAMRSVLVDWLAEVHHKFKLLPETLFLSVNIMDRFLSERGVSLVKLQLVGITSLFLASKYEEIVAPSVTNFVYMADGAFTEQEILNAERYVLQVLHFQLNYPSPLNFLRRISKADNYDIHSRTVAKYLMEIPLLDHDLLIYPPSLTAAASMCLARHMLGQEDWHANLIHYSGYTHKEIEPCIEKMMVFLQQATHSDTFIYKKYSTKRFLKASVFVRDWLRAQRAPSSLH
ncbi:G2/mitotic-specific cyclin [Mortierella antarctica]|nr:G2/mitotic-specific cyclin [Mortierella antarctica]